MDGGAVRTARNAALLLATEIVGKASTFIFTVVAARALSRTEFGAFAYALAFAPLVAAVPAWGFNPVVVREGSRSREELPRLYSEALAWRTALIVPVFVVAGVVGAVARPSASAAWALVLVLAAAAFDLYADTSKAAAAVLGRLGGWARGLLVNRLVSMALGIGLLWAGFGLVGLCVGYFAGSVLGAGFAVVAVSRSGVRPSWSLVRRPSWLSMGRASVVLGLDALAAMALSKVDTVLLGGLKGDREVAVYGAGYRLLETVLFVTWSLNTVVFPRTSAARDDGEVRRLTEGALGAVAALFVPFGVVLAVRGGDVLSFVFGGEYSRAGGGTVVAWLAPAAMAFAIGYFCSTSLLSRGRNGWVLGASVAAVAVNVAANLVVIPEYGAEGAAAVTTASYLFEAAVLVVVLGRVVGWLRLDRVLLVPALASLPLAGALALVPGHVLLGLVAGGALYGLAWLALAARLSPEVVAILKSAARRAKPE